jgi:hypothetical protein
MGKKSETSKAPAGRGSRVIDAGDTARFKEAAQAWVSANTASRATAREKLRELGFIDAQGKPTKLYR